MQVKVYPDYQALSRAVADVVGNYITSKPKSLVCLASGSTPVQLLRFLVEDVRSNRLDLSECHFVGLDEWAGVPVSDYGSCRNMMDRDFFHPLGIPESRICFFDGMTSDPEKECDRINSVVTRHGGLDIMLVGVGLNGHIAMNEPGTSPDLYAHVGDLAADTIEVGQKYFTQPTTLSKGLTLGIGNFREATLPILMANGSKKAPVIRLAVEGTPSLEVPASIVQSMPAALVMVDAEAGSLLVTHGFRKF